jgi:hypothetical protein
MSCLEAVLLLTTSDEINDGRFFNFCNQFLSMKKNNLHFHIFINNSNYDEVVLLEYISKLIIFKSTNIHVLNISEDLDIYIRNGKSASKIPPLGLTSGPNIIFLKAIKYCFNKFDTVLVLETDCCLKQKCFEVSQRYIENMCDFLISGSRYVGHEPATLLSTFNIHLNGVAFYKTGSHELRLLVQKMENYILSEVKKNPYDIVSYDMAFTNCLVTDIHIVSARRTLSKLINNIFIINCSPSKDQNITQEEIDTIYPKHVIFHTKRNYWDSSQQET